MTRTGVFTISLDLELYWGVRDTRTLQDYGDNLRGVWTAVPAMLELFRDYRVHATWATVGFLMCGSVAELRRNLPVVRPAYDDATLSPYPYIERHDELDAECHFAPALIEHIRRVPGQEIGTHTFSHFYCLERGGTPEAFAADIAAAQSDARRRGIELSSVVLPRNQYSEAHLAVLARAGLRSFRGNEPHPLYDFTEKARNTRAKRLLRIADAYVNLTGHHLFDPWRAPRPDGLKDVPASRFLRPFDARLAWLDRLRLARIRASLDEAATRGLGFHLWWHPHNFGARTGANLDFLRRVLDHFAGLRERCGMRSLNMGEVAQLRPVADRAVQPRSVPDAGRPGMAH